MRIATFDSGDPEMYFDNPNLRWADPAYLLEPGDPGYVNPFPSITNQTNKRKKMKHNNFFPIRKADQVVWLGNYALKLPDYATPLGLLPADVTGRVADCKWISHVLQTWLPATRAWSLACTDAATATLTGIGSGVQVLPVFTPPAVPATVAAVAVGALNRIFTQVAQIKASGKLTDAIASDLGIVGSEVVVPDLSTVRPVITAKVSGSSVEIKWNWQGNRAWLDGCEFLVDRGDSHGFVPLVIDTTPNYIDTQPFPVAKTVWTYKAIYRVDDHQVGLWSATVSVSVPN